MKNEIMVIERKLDRTGARLFEIRAFDGIAIGNTAVEVERSSAFGKKELRPARINWPGCGAQEVAFTDVFASLLIVATTVAKAINNDATVDMMTLENIISDQAWGLAAATRLEKVNGAEIIFITVRQ